MNITDEAEIDPEDEDPECLCIQIDADLLDARYCPAHGPNSELAREQRRREAEEEADFWKKIGEF